MNRLENTFSIKRVRKITDTDYLNALKIYSKNTPTSIKTSPDEIGYWLSNYDEANKFELLVFSLILDNIVIGFAMLSYISQHSVIIIDYICFEKEFQVNTTFFTYLNLIQNYIVEESKVVDYFVVEISNKDNGENIDSESKFFKKLICLEEFNKIDAYYSTLKLGINDYEGMFEAFIYLKEVDKSPSISKETYLNIVKSIYFSYYEEWYRPFLTTNDFEQYKLDIKMQYKKIKDNLPKEAKIKTTVPNCPLHSNNDNIRTNGPIPSRRNIKRIYLLPIIFLITIITSILIVMILNYASYWIDISSDLLVNTGAIIFTALISTAFALLYKNYGS